MFGRTGVCCKIKIPTWGKSTCKKHELEFLFNQMANVEAEMEKKLVETGIDQYMLSFPGMGIVTADDILGEIGDPKRFESWEQIRKYAGFNLVEDSSGDRKGRTVVSKRGRAMLRNILYQAEFVMVAKNKEMKLLYHHLTDRKENPLTFTKIQKHLLR